jgi:hypothetical protein
MCDVRSVLALKAGCRLRMQEQGGHCVTSCIQGIATAY